MSVGEWDALILKGVCGEVTDRKFLLKEHTASAPAFVGPRHLDSTTDGAAECGTVKTACKKLFPFSRYMFLESDFFKRVQTLLHCYGGMPQNAAAKTCNGIC